MWFFSVPLSTLIVLSYFFSVCQNIRKFKYHLVCCQFDSKTPVPFSGKFRSKRAVNQLDGVRCVGEHIYIYREIHPNSCYKCRSTCYHSLYQMRCTVQHISWGIVLRWKTKKYLRLVFFSFFYHILALFRLVIIFGKVLELWRLKALQVIAI